MEGVNLAIQWTQLPIEIETDCLVGYNMLARPEKDRSRYAMLVDQTKRLMREGRDFKLAHVAREENGVSHYLANFGRLEERTSVWLGSGPGDAPDLCKNDLPD